MARGKSKVKFEQYVADMVRWFYEIKLSRDLVERNYQESKYDFELCMKQHFDSSVNEEGKIEVKCEGIREVKKIIVSRVIPSTVKWDIQKLKKVISPSYRKAILSKKYEVKDWKGLFELLKNSGVDFKEFLKYVNVTETVNEKVLDQLIDTGQIDEVIIRKCASVEVKKPYYKFSEVLIDKDED